ncbi:MAG: hybrid sensor histidine kinase/response regulator [Desulfobacteraceae bacterium]|nr:hybrid sensor histidine kinase/response regulator [Desulfobacteraceae bacterium]
MANDVNLFADEDMLDLFRMEVEMHSSALENGLIELEADPQSSEKINPLMRAAHSIKGAARIVGLNEAVNLAHAMEDLLCSALEKRIVLGSPSIDVLLRGGDAFRRLAQLKAVEMAGWLKENRPEFSDLEEKLKRCIASTPDPVAPPATEAKGPGHPEPPSAAVAIPPAISEPEPEASPLPAILSESVQQVHEVQLQDSKPPAAAPSGASPGGTVPVLAEHLSSLVGLAGECLVESRRLLSRVRELYELKSLLTRVPPILEEIRTDATLSAGSEDSKELVARALKASAACRETLMHQIESFETYTLHWENLSTRLYNEALATKMRPFSDGVHGFPRMVRDIARNLGKKINLRISGENTRVDRDILVKLEAPLTHLLRNACDHGIETPEERIGAGKVQEGTIELGAFHRSGMLVVTVRDDGRGIDIGNIRRKVVEKGLVAKQIAENLTESELMDFLFLPGFSTAEKVTEVSGRGVGLDVVMSMVQEVRGTIGAKTRTGSGTFFSLELPLSLSTIRALLVEIGGEPYAFPLTRLDSVLMVPRDRIEVIEGRQYYSFIGRNIGLVAAYQPLELQAVSLDTDELPVVVVSDKLNRYGVVVERMLGEAELVVQPLDPRLGKVPNTSAASVMEDGSPVLVIDVDDLVRSIDNMLTGSRVARIERAAARSGKAGARRILVVDDSITVREVERRLLQNQGYEVEVAVDGMDGWNAVRNGAYDLVISDIDMPRMDGIEMVKNIKQDPETGNLPVIILSYKDREEDKIRGMEAGADYYLTKSSFYDESFLKAVVDLIGSAGGE